MLHHCFGDLGGEPKAAGSLRPTLRRRGSVGRAVEADDLFLLEKFYLLLSWHRVAFVCSMTSWQRLQEWFGWVWLPWHQNKYVKREWFYESPIPRKQPHLFCIPEVNQSRTHSKLNCLCARIADLFFHFALDTFFYKKSFFCAWTKLQK